MLLTIDLESAQPIYLQIRNGVVQGIADGRLKDGETLPSVRTLASELGINLHTVNKAYHMLKNEGFVRSLRKKGTVIFSAGLANNKKDFLEGAEETIRNIVSEAIARSIRRDKIIDMVNCCYEEMGGEDL